jgi:hypothetical protein
MCKAILTTLRKKWMSRLGIGRAGNEDWWRTQTIMLALCLTALVFPGAWASADFRLENLKACYSQLGPERKSLEFYPGERICLRYFVRKARTGADGKVDLTASIRLDDAKGNPVVVEPQEPTQRLFFGSDLFLHWSSLLLKCGLEPGQYTCTLTVADRLAGREARWVQKIKVRPRQLAIVPVGFAYDLKGEAIAPAGGYAGQMLYTKWAILGLEPGPGKVNLLLELRVRDAEGRLLIKPATTSLVNDNPLPMSPDAAIDFVLPLSRPGAFVLWVKATDRITKKSAEFETTFHVSQP